MTRSLVECNERSKCVLLSWLKKFTSSNSKKKHFPQDVCSLILDFSAMLFAYVTPHQLSDDPFSIYVSKKKFFTLYRQC